MREGLREGREEGLKKEREIERYGEVNRKVWKEGRKREIDRDRRKLFIISLCFLFFGVILNLIKYFLCLFFLFNPLWK